MGCYDRNGCGSDRYRDRGSCCDHRFDRDDRNRPRRRRRNVGLFIGFPIRF